MPQRFTPKEMLARLVAFPTVSRNSNLDLIDFVETYLTEHGLVCHRVPNPEGTKANLFTRIGPDLPGGVVLSGHSDVVPIDGQDWSSDPFRLIERDGKLYGRGACDMKGYVATVLALVPEMIAADLKRPIQIAVSHDEEVGYLGVGPMIREMRQTLPPASVVFVGEPTMMKVVTSHKGILEMLTTVSGHEVHSSLLDRGVSAIAYGARLVTWLNDQTAENRRRAEAAAAEGHVSPFDPPYTSLHVGLINGGTAHNITARTCTFSTDIRVLPTESMDEWRERYLARTRELEAEMKAVHPDASIDVRVRVQAPGCAREPDDRAEAEMLARSLTGDNGIRAVPYGTEAGCFQSEGYSVCVCGPGDIAQAHQADEYLTVEQLDAGTAFMRKLIDHLAA